MVRSVVAAVLAVCSLPALSTDKEDAARALQQLNPPASVCYSLRVIRPLVPPETDGKPKRVPLAAVLKGGGLNDTSITCTAPGEVLEASDEAPRPEQPGKVSPALVPALKNVQNAVKAKDFLLADQELVKAEAMPNKSEFDQHVIDQFRRMIDARLNLSVR